MANHGETGEAGAREGEVWGPPALNLNLRFFAWPAMVLLLVGGPLFRGLFFEPDLLPAQILMAVVFLLVAWQEVLERRRLLGRHPLDWAALALAAAYGLAYFAAVDRRAAYGEVLKYGTYAMAYYVASRLVAAAGAAGRGGSGARGGRGGHGGHRGSGRGHGTAEGAGTWSPARAVATLAGVVVASAALVAGLGVLAAAGVVDFLGALAGGRIMSTLQYPNTLGALLVMADLLGLALLAAGGRLAVQAAGGAVLYLLVAALLGAFSRGAWLAGLAGLALLLAALPPSQRWRALYVQGVTLVLAGLAMRSVLPGMGTPGWHGVRALAAGLVLAASLVPAYEVVARRLARLPLRPRTRRLGAWLAGAYAVIVGAFYFTYTASVLPRPTSQILPDAVVYRAEAIDPGQGGVVHRKEFMRDALRIWRDRPLLGAGGGGWNALYHEYQRSLYWTTEVHSAPLQVAVEAGVPGAAAFLAAWWLFVRGAWRLWRRAEEERGDGPGGGSGGIALPAGLAAAGLSLGIHSAGDFDLSLPAVALSLWTVLGSLAGLEMARTARRPASAARGGCADPWAGEESRRSGGGRPAWQGLGAGASALAAALAACALALPSASLFQAGRLGAEGARLMAEGELQAAAEKMEAAAARDPRRASYRLDLGQILSVVGAARERRDLLDQGEGEVRAALALQPRDIRVVARAVEVFTLQGKPDAAAEQAERLAALLPLATFPYERLAVACVAAAQAQLRYGERDRAEAYIAKAIDLPERVGRLRRAGNRLPGAAWPEVTPTIRLAAAQALYLRGDDAAAAAALQPLAGSGGPVGEAAAFWLAAARVRQGETPQVTPEQREALEALVRLPRPAELR